MTKNPKSFDILPNVTTVFIVLVVLGGCWLFIRGSLAKEQLKRAVYIAYSLDDPNRPTSFISLDADGDVVSGFRNPQYPRALVEIEVENTVFSPYRRGQRVPMAALNSTKSFTVRISDGNGEESNGQYWDYPTIKEQWDSYQPNYWAKHLVDEEDPSKEILIAALSGIPDEGEPIPSPRKEMLISLTIDALVNDGYRGIGEGIQNQNARYSHVVWSGWLKLAGFASVILLVGWSIEKFRSKSAKRLS